MSSYSAQQSSISENNRSRILQYLYHNGISSRAQIAKLPQNYCSETLSKKPETWKAIRIVVPSA